MDQEIKETLQKINAGLGKIEERETKISRLQIGMSLLASILAAIFGAALISIYFERWIGKTGNNIVSALIVALFVWFIIHKWKQGTKYLEQLEKETL